MPVLSLKEIIDGPKVSNWQGSEKTRDMVKAQIASRWGQSEVANYRPNTNALPFSVWARLGYRPRKGSKSLKSVTYIERKDANGKITKFARKVNLFYYRDVVTVDSHD